MTTQRPIRLLVLAAAPVFYQVPLYRLLAEDPRVELSVLYASSGGVRPYDAGFGSRSVSWDVDLLGGYRYEFLRRAEENDVRGGFFALRDWDVVGHVLRGDVDVLWVHSYSYVTTWLAILAARLRRIPVLLREEQTLLRRRPWPKRWIRALVLRLLFRTVHGLAIGTNNRAYFRHYGLPPARLSFVPYCVDNQALRQTAHDLAARRSELRARFGLDSSDPVVLVVGKLADPKEPLLALEAFALVRRTVACNLLFVGEGPLDSELRCRIASEGIPGVGFAGFLNRSEIAEAYAVADVFVLPSRSETWGIAVNEAMNFALPLIVTDCVGSAVDLVRDGENGFIVPSGDAATLASALRELLSDPLLRERFGRRSLELVESWSYDVAREGVVRACLRGLKASQRLRVAFLPLLPADSAATRLLCEKPLPYLEAEGIDATVFPPSGLRVYRWSRRRGLLRMPMSALYWYALVLPRRLVQIVCALRADVVVVQRGLLRTRSFPFLELLLWWGSRALGRRLVYHLDDALYESTSDSRYRLRCRLADWVVTGNGEIAAYARQVNPNVWLWDGPVDVGRYPRKRRGGTAEVVLGWVGTWPDTHLGPIAEALRRVLDQTDATLKVVAGAPPATIRPNGRVVYEPWREEREFAQFGELDVGLAPLEDTPYNRGKEAFKVKEYMAAGLPVVASPVGHNRQVVQHGCNGFLAESEDDWVRFLLRLIEDADLRQRMGDAGRRHVGERYDLPGQAGKLADFLRSVAAARLEPAGEEVATR